MTHKKTVMQRTALILIDLQNDFCHPEGTASKRGASTKTMQPAFKQIEELLQWARKQKLPIIHAVSEHSEWTSSPSKNERYGRTNQQKHLTYCEPGSWGAEIYEPFTPLPDEKVVIKHRYSAFYQTDLELILRSLGIQEIILLGVYTDVCIDTTARDGYMRDFKVIIPEDGVASNQPHKHQLALDLLEGTFAKIVTAKDFIKQWTTKGESS